MIKTELALFAMKVAQQIGRQTLRGFRRPGLVMQSKAYGEEFSRIDVAADRLAHRLIQQRFPTHEIMSEELAAKEKTAPHLWVVDPLDGTTNFRMGVPLFGTQLAYVEGERTKVGVIHLSALEQTYAAQVGQGAWCNQKRIHVSSAHHIQNSTIAFCYGHTPRGKKLGVQFHAQIVKTVPHIRIYGSAAAEFALVAEGGLEAFMVINMKPWDVAPGAVLVREAGGKVTDERGRDWRFGTTAKMIVVSNGKIHQSLLRIAQSVLRS